MVDCRLSYMHGSSAQEEGSGRMAASVSGATICLQKVSSKSRRARDASSAFARRSVAAPRPAHGAKASVIRCSDAGKGRGQHCAPLRAVVDAAPIATKKVYPLACSLTN